MIKKGKIEILGNVVIDNNLPKHYGKVSEINNSFISGSGTIADFIERSEPNSRSDAKLEYLEYLYYNNNSVRNKLTLWLYRKLFCSGDKPQKTIDINKLLGFFEDIKVGVSDLNKKEIDETLSKYASVLKNAHDNGQIALQERIVDYASLLKLELILSTSKFNRFLTEEDAVKFYEKASVHGKFKTNLKLTYIKNFVKIIPNDVVDLKKQADDLCVFDNYVILHYDYDNSGNQDTKAEVEKKKDPILFGLIKGSRKLYFIGDWIDDYCDLTLDALIKTIGKSESGEINSESLEQSISKI